MHKHSILDTIDCATIGYDEKPDLLPKRERPLDADDPPILPYTAHPNLGVDLARTTTSAPRVARALRAGWQTQAQIIARTGLSPAQVQGTLTQMQMAGVVEWRRAAGMGDRQHKGSSHYLTEKEWRMVPGKDAPRSIDDEICAVVGNEWMTGKEIGVRCKGHPQGRYVTTTASRLVAQGLLEVRRQKGQHEHEFRASHKLMLQRMRAESAD